MNQTFDLVKKNSFSIDIFGLGYVGFPLAVRLANGNVKVNGIDINSKRIERLQENQLMDSEVYLKNEFMECRKNNHLELSMNPKLSELPKIGIICVHTPISNGNVKSNKFVIEATEKFLNSSKEGDIIIIESSVSGGTTKEIKKIVESKGYTIGENFGVCFCPERIDPQNKKWNLENIPRIIYCSDDISFEIMKIIYHHVNNANLLRVSSSKVAEVVKSYENAFRLVNISLVNELAILCDKLGINVKEVIKAASTKPFGFMPFFPGAGAGGHCIPKDPRFLLEAAMKNNLEFNTIQNALEINSKIPLYICDKIEDRLNELGLEKTVLVCGLTYKADVEDMRDSPGFKILNELKSRNFNVIAHDPFYKSELLEKYLKENYLVKLDFEHKNNLDHSILEKINCLCVVQHHTKDKYKIKEIYEKSNIPFIYDCQNQIVKNIESKTFLDFLGNVNS